MTKENIERYYSSLSIVNSMYEKGLINEREYAKAENHLAKKYCIKKGSIYRANDLINNKFRAIYVMRKKEVQNANENNNENRCITTIRKEN